MKLELFYYDQCPFCQRTLRSIKDAGIESKVTFRNTLTDIESRNYHTEKTGRSTVPCLYIDDTPLFESSDIAIWINDNKDNILK